MFGCSIADSQMKVKISMKMKISMKSYSVRSFFFSVYSVLPFRVNCQLQLAGLGKKERQPEANLLYVESDLSATDTRDKSFKVFSPIEALNLIVESKSQSVE